jgi:predicted heme/steroid binding protein
MAQDGKQTQDSEEVKEEDGTLNADNAGSSGSGSSLTTFMFPVVIAVAYFALTNDYASGGSSSGGSGERMVTAEELSKHDGEQDETIWIAVLGQVYDVTAGKEYYGIGEGYAGFAGRDGTKAFVTGDFNEGGLVSDVSEFTAEQMMGVNHWKEFYFNSTKYFNVGKLIGRFFDAQGRPTAEHKQAIAKIAEGKLLEKDKEDRKKANPSCNMKWSQDKGGEVWCADETMLPRKASEGGGKRCACFTPQEVAARDDLEGYDGCGPRDARCATPA